MSDRDNVHTTYVCIGLADIVVFCSRPSFAIASCNTDDCIASSFVERRVSRTCWFHMQRLRWIDITLAHLRLICAFTCEYVLTLMLQQKIVLAML